MQTLEEVQRWLGHELYGAGQERLGEITEVYLDSGTDQPEWLTVRTGLFGTKVSFVPIGSASMEGDQVMVPFSKQEVKDAPNVTANGELSAEQERRLYDHYGLEWGEFDAGPKTDSAMTRSEEDLVVGTKEREVGRARLRKHVVADEVQQTVPVRREEVRVEREPVSRANIGEAVEGPAIHAEEHEMTLHAEEPVLEKRVVPKERVGLSKDTHVDEQTVSGEVRQERIEVDGDVSRG